MCTEYVFRKFQRVLSFFPRSLPSRSWLPLFDSLPTFLPKFTVSHFASPPLQTSIFGLFVRGIVKTAFGPFAKTGQSLRRSDNQGKRIMLYAEKEPGESLENLVQVIFGYYTK